MIRDPADALVMFGITGDLAKKKLIPALYELTAEGRLEMPVVGAARSDWTDEELRDHVRKVLIGRDPSVIERLCARLTYVVGDYQEPGTYREIKEKLAGSMLPVFFMAIPPSLFDDVATGLAAVDCNTTGRLVVDADAEAQPYERVALSLEGPGRERSRLRFLDVRKFGRFRFEPDPTAFLSDLGPEPLGPDFTAPWFRAALRRRDRALKPLLLDQTFLAGLGNIYVDESLFRAGLHPLRPASRVPRDRADALHVAIREVLAAAVEREGSSFDAFYRTPEGQPGQYQHLFQVYGRDGQPCPRCGRAIKKLVVGQRGTHICTRCQPAPRRRSR